MVRSDESKNLATFLYSFCILPYWLDFYEQTTKKIMTIGLPCIVRPAESKNLATFGDFFVFPESTIKVADFKNPKNNMQSTQNYFFGIYCIMLRPHFCKTVLWWKSTRFWNLDIFKMSKMKKLEGFPFINSIHLLYIPRNNGKIPWRQRIHLIYAVYLSITINIDTRDKWYQP
jgi:hypothetical protein